MVTPEEARQYLEEVLAAEGANWAEVSQLAGMNHAYIQQYLRRGKPRYLPEAVRTAIIRHWPSVDPDKLRPPPRESRASLGKRQNQSKIHAQGHGKIVDDPHTLELLDAWDRITRADLRELVLRTARAMAGASDSRAA